MRSLHVIFLVGAVFTAALSQSARPKQTAAKPKADGKAAASTSTKPKPAVTPAKKLNEKDEWERANAATDVKTRIAALKKFVVSFPKSVNASEAVRLISAAEAELGNEKLGAGETESALKFFRSAVKDAPMPIPEQLFTESLSKFPANLYFRGLRDEALEIAKVLENKAEANTAQLLNIANFYLSIEDGAAAKRLAENAIKAEPDSSAAYQTLGLANRVDFNLEESAAAYAKALEIEPESITARRGLAEMRRALGKPEEAIALYREILSKDDGNIPARTGLILALFDAEKRADAEAEMARSLETNPGNVILLAGAAYWYAAHNDGTKAIDLAHKAIEADPRFIWSHIALARGFLNQKRAASAEQTLLAARQFGNFPTLEYEIASARAAAGLYREAAEELSKSFSIVDGVVRTKLGGRVPVEATTFADLIAAERKASIFTPNPADSAANFEQLKALLVLQQELGSVEPRVTLVASAADDFVRGDDKMKIHRELFAASALLDKKVALSKVIEFTKDAPTNLDVGLDVDEPATAVMASELYEDRKIAAAAGRYINVPNVPRQMLSAVLRGRIEEIAGWASFQMDDAADAIVHLKRAVGVLPVDSAWWRSSTWQLGSALAVSGNDVDALEAYIKSYKSSGPNSLRYSTIASLYKRVKGNTDGLAERIGPDPSAETVAQKVEQPANSSGVIKTESIATETSTATPVVTETSGFTAAVATSTPLAANSVEPTSTPTATLGNTPESSSTASPATTLDVLKTSTGGPVSVTTENKPPSTPPKELFPSVVITILQPDVSKTTAKNELTPISSPTAENPTDKPKPAPSPTAAISSAEPGPTTVATVPVSTPEIKPCALIVDIDNIALKNSEGVLAVIVRREQDQELDGLTATSASPRDVNVRREIIDGLKTQALFVVRSISTKTGTYQVVFEMPCGKREITVNVQ